VAALRFYERQPKPAWTSWLSRAAAHFRPFDSFLQSRSRAASNVRFHYDRSNEFYRLFLGPSMVYSCAYFKDPSYTLDGAQEAKLDHICRKLDLKRGESLLDIGCGWGSLILH